MPFAKFSSHKVTLKNDLIGEDGVTIHCLKGGDGPGLLLLHGYPQNHFIWHLIADDLASKFTVIAADLRGYGQSSKPQGSENHVEYSKREMATDQVALMKSFGFSEFFLVAHDRGARVAHRLAVDHPVAVKKMMLLDICPTLLMYESTDMRFASGYWHWFFNIMPYPHPENIIMADPLAFWNALVNRSTHSRVVLTSEAIEKYKSDFFKRETVHASCEDYRASATIDLDHDRFDISNGRKMTIPALRILWGSKTMIPTYGDVVGHWKKLCDEQKTSVTGRVLDCGHFIPEDKSEELLQEILDFFLV
jgi:haloacetate dehalogenase